MVQPQEVFPTSTEVRKNREYWNKRSITYHGEKRYFDQVVRTGECHFCKKYGRTQNYHKQTYLHHLDYDDDAPLMWTLELCSGCHYRLDKKNRRRVDRSMIRVNQKRMDFEMRRITNMSRGISDTAKRYS